MNVDTQTPFRYRLTGRAEPLSEQEEARPDA